MPRLTPSISTPTTSSSSPSSAESAPKIASTSTAKASPRRESATIRSPSYSRENVLGNGLSDFDVVAVDEMAFIHRYFVHRIVI